ncbi:hypothetical protein ANCCAN_15421 [Ancylostoma caninum]|uniref:Uncharacterized protein n=1 Tax=Ancylostoma caninum TaxID=29170 RepID=A0A368G2J4_ANCCA|nr:hypothetical protein ANCCAN_15421 [Ancylostoma caninum]
MLACSQRSRISPQRNGEAGLLEQHGSIKSATRALGIGLDLDDPDKRQKGQPKQRCLDTLYVDNGVNGPPKRTPLRNQTGQTLKKHKKKDELLTGDC